MAFLKVRKIYRKVEYVALIDFITNDVVNDLVHFRIVEYFEGSNVCPAVLKSGKIK